MEKENVIKQELSSREFLRKHRVRRKRGYEAIKRAQDIVLSGLGIVVSFPVILAVAAAIWIDDPHGSPIFVQERCGRNGNLFKIYKFRSMYMDAEKRKKELEAANEMDGPVFKIKNDPRITKVGKFIRKTSLDELPQFFNIFKGDMSIVGPRPALLKEVMEYDEECKRIICIKPGLTSYRQIHPRRNELTFKDWMELDLKYIENRSMLTDWGIMLKTVGVVLKGEGQ